jgi:hypothetical protein
MQMKTMVCEMCDGTDIIKQDGVFVCQSCGTKYSVEEAKKMMFGENIGVRGNIKIDSSDEINKLYQAARNARDVSDDETAIRHYESISAKEPSSWEALFYLVILKTNAIKNGEIASAAIRVSNSINRVFQLIKEYVPEEKDKKIAIKEVIEQCYATATWLTSASHEFHKTITKGNGMIALTGVTGAISSFGSSVNALAEDNERCLNIANIMYNCGNAIDQYFEMADIDYQKYAMWSWKKTLELNSDYKRVHNSEILNKDDIQLISSKINKYDASYNYFEIEREMKMQSLPNSATSPKWGVFMTISMIVFCVFPLTGALISGSALYSTKKGDMTNINTNVAKTTLIINILVSFLLAITIINSIGPI